MNDTKEWYRSRTIWAAAVAIGAGVAGMFGFPLDGIDNSALADKLLDAVTAIAGIVAILGRLSADTKIG